MAKIWVAPTGTLVKGHVLDVSPALFERSLRDYDSQLYIKWNPKKLRGWGAWEIRRHPEKKSVYEVLVWEGNTYCRIEYLENNLVNHVLDCAFLNYDQLRKIKEIDTWANGTKDNFSDHLETKEKEHVAKGKAKARESMLYAARQNKKAFRDFKDMVQSGLNPAMIANHWDKPGQKS